MAHSICTSYGEPLKSWSTIRRYLRSGDATKRVKVKPVWSSQCTARYSHGALAVVLGPRHRHLTAEENLGGTPRREGSRRRVWGSHIESWNIRHVRAEQNPAAEGGRPAAKVGGHNQISIFMAFARDTISTRLQSGPCRQPRRGARVLAKQRVGYQKAGEKCTQTATLLLGAGLTGEDFSFIFLFCIAGPLDWYVLPAPASFFLFFCFSILLFWHSLLMASPWHSVDLSRVSLRGSICGSLRPADG